MFDFAPRTESGDAAFGQICRRFLLQILLQALQLAFLEGVRPGVNLSVSPGWRNFFLFASGVKGKTKGSTQTFCFHTACAFAQPCFCRYLLHHLACPQALSFPTDSPPSFCLMLQYCMSLVIFYVHVPPTWPVAVYACFAVPELIAVCIFSIMMCIFLPIEIWLFHISRRFNAEDFCVCTCCAYAHG